MNKIQSNSNAKFSNHADLPKSSVKIKRVSTQKRDPSSKVNNIRATGSPEYCLYSDNDICKSSNNSGDLKEGGGSEKKSQFTREEIPKSRGMISTVLAPKREQKSRQSISENRLI